MAELQHGKASTYNNHKCRCDACKKAWADYIREGGYVKRYQEKKRKEKLQKEEDPAIIYYTFDEFLQALNNPPIDGESD